MLGGPKLLQFYLKSEASTATLTNNCGETVSAVTVKMVRTTVVVIMVLTTVVLAAIVVMMKQNDTGVSFIVSITHKAEVSKCDSLFFVLVVIRNSTVNDY